MYLLRSNFKKLSEQITVGFIYEFLYFKDSSSSPDVNAETSRTDSPDLPNKGITNASHFLEDETLKTCLSEADLVQKATSEQEEFKAERKPLQETIGMIDVVKKCADEEEEEKDSGGLMMMMMMIFLAI